MERAISDHPDLQSEQAYIDNAYECLGQMQAAARELLDSVLSSTPGGTHQARYQRDVLVLASSERLAQLDLGHESLCFGRMDAASGETFYIGRLAVSGPDMEALVVDWRVPVAEPFYRATGRHTMGLRRRRHFLADRKTLTAIEDELFSDDPSAGELGLAGPGALLESLERRRTGSMRDIVATIQAEQDEVIRSDLSGVLAVQGGPGTGKTAVALHRAAYLIFTHRQRLERRGMLFVGPNRLFLRYINRVLPALGETGVALTTPSGMYPSIRVVLEDPQSAARVKGDLRMAELIRTGIQARQRKLDRTQEMKVGGVLLEVTPRITASAVAGGRRARGSHNARRSNVRKSLVRSLFGQYVKASGRVPAASLTRVEFTETIEEDGDLERILDQVWPVSDPPSFLHEVLSTPLLDRLGRGLLSSQEIDAIRRDPAHPLTNWTRADVALLDEAAVYLGAIDPTFDEMGEEDIELPTYGHVIVDEVQDLSAMQLRMIGRRCPDGSMTVVGDVDQVTTPGAPGDWDEILQHLVGRAGARRTALTVNYRTPQEIMDLANRMLGASAAAPSRSVRSSGEEPKLIRSSDVSSDAAREAGRALEIGKVALIADRRLHAGLSAALTALSLDHGVASADGIDHEISVCALSEVKGLEFDAVIIVEPVDIWSDAGGR
ncbi:MAG TPA: AAA family ATPase, partial [Actinomycetota bacterium]|nr:AAA family ATPase [Actinomycetota bacterium]